MGFLERLDLFLAAGNTILVTDTRINARWLKLVEVGKSGIELLLGTLQIGLLGCQSLFLVLLLGGLVLNISGLFGLVHFGISHELVIFLLRTSFSCLSVRLQARKIRLDHLKHANDTTRLATHTLIWFVESLRRFLACLDKSSRLCCLCVELL